MAKQEALLWVRMVAFCLVPCPWLTSTAPAYWARSLLQVSHPTDHSGEVPLTLYSTFSDDFSGGIWGAQRAIGRECGVRV